MILRYNLIMKTKRFATTSIFAAIIIVLQIISTYVNFGGFPITLTLIPIIIAGAAYGPMMGLLMGLVFGAVVNIMVILGLDPSGAVMLATHPVVTIVTCELKGALAGLFGALAYKYIRKNKIGIVVDAIITPVVNTLILYLALILFFDTSFAAMIAAFMSINFVIELLINILIAPGLLGLINRVKNRQVQ